MTEPAAMMKAAERLWLAGGSGAALKSALTAAQIGEVYLLDGARARDKASFMSAIAATLRLPDYFGRNWDALVDCIDEIHWRDQPVVLVVDHGEQLLADAPGEIDTFLDVIDEAVAPNPELPDSRLKVVFAATAPAPVVERARQRGLAVGTL
jgi:RNAse (barnase) inhibitor barstar